MSIPKDLILFAVVLIGAACAGLWVLESTQDSDVSASRQEQAASAEIARIPYAENATSSNPVNHDEAVQKQFEDFINDFLDQLTEDIRAYKIKRQIVRDFIEPVNVRNEAYLAENNELMQQLSEEMIGDMDRIILSFDTADKKIHNLVSASITDNKNIILNKWNTIKNDQLDVYISYFIFEKELLSAYHDVFNFYLALGDNLKVDTIENEIVFSNPKNEKTYENLLERIESVKKESALVLKKFSQRQVDQAKAQN